jgi:hypothetical protein
MSRLRLNLNLNPLFITVKTLTLSVIVAIGFVSQAQAQTFTGNSSGTWGNPTVGSNDAPNYSGVGTDTFSWGDPADFGTGANVLTFTGNSISTPIDSIFKVGDLTYFNGSVASGTTVDSVPLNVLLNLQNPVNKVAEYFGFNFKLVSTPNTGTPEENADFVYVVNNFSDSTFKLANSDYTLKLTGFSQNGGVTSVDQFRVLENQKTTAAIFGKIVQVPSTDPSALPIKVPESTSLVGLSLLGIYLISSRKISTVIK